MSDFVDAIGVVLAHEGGSAFTADPSDPGGATKYGISLRFLRAEGLDLDHDGDVDADDVKGLDAGEAAKLYRERFWDRYGYGSIHDQLVATKVFDICVNTGGPRAHRILQNALCCCKDPVDVDGVFGRQTLAAVNRCNPQDLVDELITEQERYYRTLVEVKPQLSKYLAGWLHRAAWPNPRRPQ